MRKSVVIRKLLSYDEVFATGYRRRTKELLPMAGSGDFDLLPLSKDFWYADPIIFTKNGRSYLFMEAFDKKMLLGRIAYCELTEDGPTLPKLIIKEPFHMSFPTVFEFEDEIYMVPETSSDKSLRLYKAIDFPSKWELAARFATDRLFVDTVVIGTDNGAIRLLTCEASPDREYECRFQKLEIRRSADGGFSIAEDEAFNSCQKYDLLSRNGGAIFEYGGQRFVAAQESSFAEYGLGMNFYVYNEGDIQIAKAPKYHISTDNFRIKGAPKGEGVHSYCFNDDYEILDLKYMEFTPSKMINRIMGRH